jgi:hypothetical protein
MPPRLLITAWAINTSLNEFTVPSNHTRKIKTDAGTHFPSRNFHESCANANIELFFAAPTQKDQIRTAKMTQCSLKTIADNMIAHAILPPKLTYHALRYAIEVFYVLPIMTKYQRAMTSEYLVALSIFIGFPPNSWYPPQPNMIAIFNKCLFDEIFSNTMVRTWRPFSYALVLTYHPNTTSYENKQAMLLL